MNGFEGPSNMILHVNNSGHYAAFVELNRDWIEEHFELEPVDRELARDPESIIRKGGLILTLTDGEEVVGVCALFRVADEEYELARMTVKRSARGKGYGRRVLDAAIEKAREIGARKLTLVSNTRLEAALNLYRSRGFITTRLGQDPVYKRADIAMELHLE